MTDVAKEPGTSLLSFIMSARHNQAARIFNIDVLTALIAILLHWTTTGVAIVATLWLVALLPSIEIRPLLRSLARPISVLPIALFALAVVGTLWSDAAWSVRIHAVSPAVKLMLLPLLFYHCERSPRGTWVFKAFLASCIAMVLVSSSPSIPSSRQISIFRAASIRRRAESSSRTTSIRARNLRSARWRWSIR